MTEILPNPPFVHDQVICVDAPAQAISGPDGQMSQAAHGFYLGDRRVLCRLLLTVDGAAPQPLVAHQAGSGGARFVGVAAADAVGPVVLVERLRGACRERVVIANNGHQRRQLRVDMWVGCDLADLTDLRAGVPTLLLPATPHPTGVSWADPRRGVRVRVTAAPGPDEIATDHLLWTVDLAAGATWTVELTVEVHQAAEALPVAAVTGDTVWDDPAVTCADSHFTELLRHSLDDLRGLALADPVDTSDVFLAAGSPWFLTLFGRDALWAARMLLPLGTRLAGGTLRALARRQGSRFDTDTDEAPGKILHEVRHPAGMLPPISYSSVDATPLFVSVLADAWRWGMPEDQVAELLPAALRALRAVRAGVEHGGGFLRYERVGAGGLRNQGWKDSPSAIQYTDGRLAAPPVALCEVQGYAYQAALDGAELLAAFGADAAASGAGTDADTDADAWREWAAALRARFHRSYWVSDDHGPYVAVALDGHSRPVDAVASNMGHLPGTGILDDDQVAAVARRLTAPDMNSGWGLRTMSSAASGFNPLGYHVGAVWPHDTVLAAAGLAACGRHAAGGALLAGLLTAARHFDYRLPELFGGDQRRTGLPPTPYPRACRPQAWAAAAAVAVLATVVGLRPHLPEGRLTVVPMRPSPLGALEVHGLRLGTGSVSLRVDAAGTPTVLAIPAGLTVQTG